jgi:predicted DsbA family dithiol-disulfide isomerase
VLVQLVGKAGLDPERARKIFESGEYAEEVRERGCFYFQHNVQVVPVVIINDKYIIQRDQPTDVFEQRLKRFAAESATA